MGAFLLGLVFGVIGKAIYDVFKEDQLPLASGLNSSRLESLLDETRQIVSDMREELRQAVETAKSTAGEKAGATRATRDRGSTTGAQTEG
jgi:hypothetical protein